MIRVNGIPLDNADMGWIFRPESVPYSALEAVTVNLTRAGRDGNVPTPSTLSGPILRLQVNTPPKSFSALQNLFNSPDLLLTRDDQPGWEAHAKLTTSSIDRVFPRNQWIDVSYYVEVSGAFWRAASAETTSQTITAAMHTLSCFAAHPVGQIAQWRNLFTNPSFETAGAATVVRTNWFPNPQNAGTPSSGRAPGWNAYTLGSPTGSYAVSGNVQQITATALAAGVGSERFGLAAVPFSLGTLRPSGTPITFSMDTSVVTLPAGVRARVYVDIQDSTNANATRANWNAYFDATTGRLSGTATINGTADVVRLYVWIENNNASAAFSGTATVGVTKLQAEISPVALPFLDGGTQPILRTNYMGDPSATASTGWALFTNSSQAAGPDSPPEGGSSRLVTTTAANGGITWQVTGVASGSNPSPAGTNYLYMSVKMNAGDLGSWYIAEYEGLTLIGRTAVANGITGTGGWLRVGGPWAKASPTSRVRLEVFKSTPGSFQVGAGYLSDSDGSHFAGTIAPRGFVSAFSGTTAASPTILWDADFSTRWQSAAGNSASELTGLAITGLGTGAGVAAIRSSRGAVAGNYAMRLVPTSPTNNVSYALIGFPPEAAGGGTFVITARQEGPLTGALWSLRGKPYTNPGTNVSPSTTPNAQGTTEHRITFPSTAAANVVLPHGGLIGSGDVWYDLVTLVAGGFTGAAFTGSTTPQDRLNVFAWDGLPDQSSSTWTVYGSWDGGLSAPVQDAVLRMKGPATGIQVTDSSGAWAILPDVPSGKWVRFEADTGAAFLTDSDTWSGGVDVSGAADYGGPRNVFEITPVMAPGDPGSRSGQVTVATATRPGAPVFEVRGKTAYLL